MLLLEVEPSTRSPVTSMEPLEVLAEFKVPAPSVTRSRMTPLLEVSARSEPRTRRSRTRPFEVFASTAPSGSSVQGCGPHPRR